MLSAESDADRTDWWLLRDGAVNLCLDQEIVSTFCRDLAELGYEIGRVSCRSGMDALRRQVSEVLQWEQQFGYAHWKTSLDALEEGFAGYPFGAAGRSAFVVDGFHLLVSEAPRVAEALLDILERTSRDHLLCGRALIAVIQTDDSAYQPPQIGCRTPSWRPFLRG